ncbi:acetyltransferase, GNAT family [Legionella lansingensis]|uniref:GNAT family acetyltransferase n=1 Tax=Legionella lansingensis TaxID=45067 RepID=A0A0W0VPL9_9GAMM|nr:GNAT family N-acetyltransferase [Legionella lansingensis]KTD22019.1 GNAT family acetyltransferase [Legionella lansingensis]SNV54005.1 acetyltransferase, GNAT family [Legionella lansingensis]
MEKDFRVERMTQEELGCAIEWATQEGWNPGLHDLACFYQTDPKGFFAGKLNDQIIAVGSAVVYDAQFAFCGFYMVNKTYRGHGYGLALTQARLAYIGQRNAGLDGVINMLDKYARLGYRIAHYNNRYLVKNIPTLEHVDEKIIPLSAIDFNRLCTYDRLHFPAPREVFLKCWIKQPEGASLGYVSGGKLCGYGVLRACQNGFKIGPLFADNPNIAETLFLTLVHHAQGEDVFIDIPDNNPNATEVLIKRYPLKKVFQTARMYLRGQPADLPSKQIYGITSLELG